MLSSDLCSKEQLYSNVVSIPRFSPSHLSSSSSETTNNENQHSNDESEVRNLSHLENDTFKIDRRKIEKMIQTSSKEVGLNGAEYFFNNIMKITSTSISWPMNLRVGARTRKDPSVHIIGRPSDIAWAKGLILASLATRGPILKMKMIIAENEYSHIIGRTGSNIKSIMEQTDTHIHFPDSNRRTLTEKSNQVLVYGAFDTLERAIVSLRLSTPLKMFFELPLGIPLSRQDMADIKQLERDFGVQITFMSIPNKSTYFAIVKGTQGIADKVKEAVRSLVNLTYGIEAANILSNIKLAISKLLFDLSNAENRINVLDLQKKTHTIISVPDPGENRQRIIITGSIEMIYEVQKKIMSYLPVELTFDIFEKPCQTSAIMSIGVKYGISISMQRKEKDNSISVTMRAAEAKMSNIFEAQQEVAEMQNTSRNKIELPKAYLLAQPAYRKTLEKNISSRHQFEEISRQIWAPIEPNIENNFLYYAKPSAEPGSSTLLSNLEENAELLGQQDASLSASLSPSTACSSVDSSNAVRSSGDWSVMTTEHKMSKHFECDFDSADMEVAFIFMSSTKNLTPIIFPNAPGAEKVCRR